MNKIASLGNVENVVNSNVKNFTYFSGFSEVTDKPPRLLRLLFIKNTVMKQNLSLNLFERNLYVTHIMTKIKMVLKFPYSLCE